MHVWGSYQISPVFVLRLLWLCCDVFSTSCVFMGSTRPSAYHLLSVPQLWSAGIAACEDSQVVFFKAVSGAECAEWILFLCSGEDSAVPALIRAVRCSPVGITMPRIKSWVLQRGTGDDAINVQLKHLQFRSKLQWKATFRKCLFDPFHIFIWYFLSAVHQAVRELKVISFWIALERFHKGIV